MHSRKFSTPSVDVIVHWDGKNSIGEVKFHEDSYCKHVVQFGQIVPNVTVVEPPFIPSLLQLLKGHDKNKDVAVIAICKNNLGAPQAGWRRQILEAKLPTFIHFIDFGPAMQTAIPKLFLFATYQNDTKIDDWPLYHIEIRAGTKAYHINKSTFSIPHRVDNILDMCRRKATITIAPTPPLTETKVSG